MRYFVNNMPDFVPGTVVNVNKEFFRSQISAIANMTAEKLSPSSISGRSCDGGLYVGLSGVAYMFLYLAVNKELETMKQSFMDMAKTYIKCSLDYEEHGGYKSDPGCSFILGKAGVNAAACLVYKGIEDKMTAYLEKYSKLGEICQKINFFPNGSDELFVGRAGYLCGVLNLEHKLKRKVLPDEIIHHLCHLTVESGRQYAQRNNSPCPLMYAYYKTEYLGAAHGLSSILQILLCFPSYLKSDPRAEKDLRTSVDFLLSLEQKNFNYPPAMDEVGSRSRPESHELVHWCHGAPGVVYLFARAYIVWRDERYLIACLRCGELTWQKGLLLKGPGICHGVAGSGYVFLLLYRLTKDQKHLHRAVKFGEFLLHPEFNSKARVPDSPLSLYEGWAGAVCFMSDLLQPEKAEFPFFNVFMD